MSAPRWARVLLARLAGPVRADEVVGDLEEAHRQRVRRRGRALAAVLTGLEALDVAAALLRQRRRSGAASAASVRAGRRGRLPIVSWIDVKLGARILMKHPGLSLISALGIAVAVAIGASVFGVIHGLTASPLPLDEGDRVVTIQNVGALGFEQARATHLHDLEIWRREVTTLGELGAYRTVTRNLITADSGVEPSRIAEMTASGFRIARVPPLLGRYLVDADEQEGAPDVAIIGHGLWQSRFGGAPEVIGRQIQVGATPHTIVGVMPPGFAFPINDRVWVPLRLNPTHFELGKAPEINVFGRLAPGASMEEASAQLATVALRAATAYPETHENLRARVFPYTQEMVWGPMAWVLYIVQALVSMLLVVIAINVGALVYARTVTRANEIAVRTALGASRGRIAAQLFAEAFLLSAAATALGLVAASFAAGQIERYVRSSSGEQAPFWWDFGLSPAALAYGVGLAVLAAIIIGVVPGLGASGKHVHARLQSAAGASGPQLGRTWTFLIVAQIAVAVGILPVALSGVGKWLGSSSQRDSRYPLDEVLVARLTLDPPARASAAVDPELDARERYAIQRDELQRRFQALPEVSHVAIFGTGPWEDPDLPFEVDGSSAAPLAGITMESASTGHRVGRSVVSPEFFEALEIPVLAGRALEAGDLSPQPMVVVVNETFVDLILGGGNALGRRMRFLQGGAPSWEPTPDAPWLTIVGVVPRFMGGGLANPEATAYLPLSSSVPGPVSFAVRIRGEEAGRTARRLREIAARIDPTLRLSGLESLHAISLRGRALTQLFVTAIAILSLSVLLLAIAGLYALMSFTVVRRRREIGIRIALGARPHSVVRGVLKRAAWQLAIGMAAGLAITGVVDRLLAGGEIQGGREGLLLVGVVAVMTIVGVLAAWGPARRGLAIQPSEALRAE